MRQSYEAPSIAEVGSLHELTLQGTPVKVPAPAGDAFVPNVGFVAPNGQFVS